MKLKVYWADMRGGYADDVERTTDVTDEDTGNTVGFTTASRSPIKREIKLFGEKYTGEFITPEECYAFAKGVESVINHITSTQIPLSHTPAED